MSDATGTVPVWKQKPVVITAVIAVVVVIIWLVAFFLPQGSKLSTLNAQQQTLQQKVAQGNAKVERLKHTFQRASQLQAMDASLQAEVPSTPDIFKTTANYTNTLSATVAASHLTLTSVSPGGAAQPPAGSDFTTVPVTLVVKGTYDNLLTFITNVYALPRLTDINQIRIEGGGPGTNRSSTLTATFSLVSFTTAKPPLTH